MADGAEPLNRAITHALLADVGRATERERTLIRRLDTKLYAMLPGQAPQAAGPATARTADEVLVTILLADLNSGTLTALKGAGFRLRSTLQGETVVIGSVRVSDLETVTLLDSVRRMEPLDD